MPQVESSGVVTLTGVSIEWRGVCGAGMVKLEHLVERWMPAATCKRIEHVEGEDLLTSKFGVFFGSQSFYGSLDGWMCWVAEFDDRIWKSSFNFLESVWLVAGIGFMRDIKSMMFLIFVLDWVVLGAHQADPLVFVMMRPVC